MPRLRFNAFSMNCVSHIHHGQWVRPDSRSSTTPILDAWIELAQLLERGKFDALFLADVVGTYAATAATATRRSRRGCRRRSTTPRC